VVDQPPLLYEDSECIHLLPQMQQSAHVPKGALLEPFNIHKAHRYRIFEFFNSSRGGIPGSVEISSINGEA
jgi:hypothetical protein